LPFLNADGSMLDQGIALWFSSPNSYTGDDVLELQGHGGPVVLDMVLARVVQLGARLARPGEFTERAFLNDKLDLAQAEAVADLIDSSSQSAAAAAVRSMSGGMSSDVQAIQDDLISLRVWLEAALDFSEEDIDFFAEGDIQIRAEKMLERFDALFARAQQGQRLRDGLTLVIAGDTNVGKSSLLNWLAGVDTAIVTDIAGTTRDVLHEQITLDGLPFHVIDTAGIRETNDPIEREGIDRARREIANADHVLVLVDATNPNIPAVELPTSLPCTLVVNKLDLIDDSAQLEGNIDEQLELAPGQLARAARVMISVKAEQGLDELQRHLLSLAGHEASIEATELALERLRSAHMPELAAEELRLAQQALDHITGKFDSEDLLGAIFSSFCIGK